MNRFGLIDNEGIMKEQQMNNNGKTKERQGTTGNKEDLDSFSAKWIQFNIEFKPFPCNFCLEWSTPVTPTCLNLTIFQTVKPGMTRMRNVAQKYKGLSSVLFAILRGSTIWPGGQIGRQCSEPRGDTGEGTYYSHFGCHLHHHHHHHHLCHCRHHYQNQDQRSTYVAPRQQTSPESRPEMNLGYNLLDKPYESNKKVWTNSILWWPIWKDVLRERN